jgi:dTDP-4-dehydrorhamnose 3,5-epimerase
LSSPASEGGAPSALPGVSYGRRAAFADARGSFSEIWRAADFGTLDVTQAGLPDAHFVQANLSRSAKGVLRGLHYHRRQLDYWVVAAGRAFVALVDVRSVMADTSARAVVETRILETGETVTIPTGVAHGFLALEPLELIYLVTNEYDGSDELGFAWDDPAVGVPWPVVENARDGRPILSGRDSASPTLVELVARLRS